MVGSETPKIRETSLRSIPRSQAASILSLRSFEYGFMTRVSHTDQPSRKPLLGVVGHTAPPICADAVVRPTRTELLHSGYKPVGRLTWFGYELLIHWKRTRMAVV